MNLQIGNQGLQYLFISVQHYLLLLYKSYPLLSHNYHQFTKRSFKKGYI